MKIKLVHVPDGIPGVATKCFAAQKGDEFDYAPPHVNVTTGPGEHRRYFGLPISSIIIEWDGPPDRSQAGPRAKK